MSTPATLTVASGPATLDDLYCVEGKAELVAGRIIYQVASGFDASWTAFEIAVALRQYAHESGLGFAFSDGIGFAVRPPLANGRQSFTPDACYYPGKRPIRSKRFIDGVPVFAVEVRSENDYGPAAEVEMAAKRADYFEAGTSIVWDVDTDACTITVYRDGNPMNPAIVYHRADVADAEPALPGWRLVVAAVFQEPDQSTSTTADGGHNEL